MAEQEKSGWLIEVFKSSRFRVVLAAMIVIYMITRLAVESKVEDPKVLLLAEIAICLVAALAAVHMALRTFFGGGYHNGKQTPDAGGGVQAD